MRMDFGKYRGKDLKNVQESYLQWVHDSYKPLLLEIEKMFNIPNVHERIERKNINELFKKFQQRYPDNKILSEFQKELIEKFYNF